MDEQNPKVVAIALTLVPKLGPISLRKKLQDAGSCAEVWQQLPLDKNECQELLGTAEKYYDACLMQNIEILSWGDKDYPNSLSAISDAPVVIFTKGHKELLNHPMVGVVGSRKATNYGSEVTKILVEQLVAQGWGIASGLAHGIDSVAHQTALDNHGQTLAVLGFSFDQLASQSHLGLINKIAENGLIVSQFPPGTPPQKFTFPARNRLLAALSKGVLVTQASPNSGALLTAAAAHDYHKQVFAVPSSIFDQNSVGTNRLIQQGAQAVVDAADIVENLGLAQAPAQINSVVASQPTFNQSQQQVVELLANGSVATDEVIRALGLPASEVLSTLSLLEMQGNIRQIGDNQYRLVRN